MVVCWITSTTWDSLILYLNSHLHCPATLRQAGTCAKIQAMATAFLEIQQQICNVAIAQDQRLSPHCTYGFYWFHAVANIRLKTEWGHFFSRQFLQPLNWLNYKFHYFLVRQRAMSILQSLSPLPKNRRDKKRRWVLKFSCKFERFLAYFQQNRRSWQRFLEKYLTNPFGQETTCVVLDAPGVYCVWVFGALCCRLGLPQLWRNYPGNSWRGKGKQHLKRKAMLKDILHRVRWDMYIKTDKHNMDHCGLLVTFCPSSDVGFWSNKSWHESLLHDWDLATSILSSNPQIVNLWLTIYLSGTLSLWLRYE